MAMTAKERMLVALDLGVPDRVPATLHQWQSYHLSKYMGGMTAQEAFREVGLDASIQIGLAGPTSLHAMARRTGTTVWSPDWVVESRVIEQGRELRARHDVTTPGGELTFVTGCNEATTWIIEYPVKEYDDIYLIRDYMPVARLDKDMVAASYDALGDEGILRGGVWGDQAGCWQHACCMIETERLIIECYDHPEWVHEFMGILLDKKLRYIAESLDGARFDLIETGGGASSDTVVSPKIHREFCLPYDRRMHDALHDAGQRVVYHTCGGMIHILDQIVDNGCDASETLSPSSMGGNVDDGDAVRAIFGGKIAMIGGLDQFSVLTTGTPESVAREVHRLFEGFGSDGGYILSASDHFFEAPVENLRAMASAAEECVY